MFASIGPRLASPPTPDVRLSSSRFKRVTSMLFREISLRLAISASYVSTFSLFRDSSASAAEASVKSSTTDLRCSVSTVSEQSRSARSSCSFFSPMRSNPRVLDDASRVLLRRALFGEIGEHLSSKRRMSRSAATDLRDARGIRQRALFFFRPVQRRVRLFLRHH